MSPIFKGNKGTFLERMYSYIILRGFFPGSLGGMQLVCVSVNLQKHISEEVESKHVLKINQKMDTQIGKQQCRLHL